MNTWIVLFRGINVGGHNVIAMTDLRSSLEELDFQNVKTYIQSGNAVFESKLRSPRTLAQKVTTHLKKHRGIEAKTFAITREELLATIANNPFPQAAEDPKSLHFFFLSTPASAPDMKGIQALQAKSENIAIESQVVYLWAPDGIGRSKLASKLEKLLGVPTTARNYRTVMKIAHLSED